MHPVANVTASADQYIIVSCHAPDFFTKCLEANHIDYKVAESCYKGEREVSYILNRQHLPFIRFMLKGDQESILLLEELQKNGIRKAQLLYLADDFVEDIGYFREADQGEASQHDAWTYRPDLNKYFICTEKAA